MTGDQTGWIASGYFTSLQCNALLFTSISQGARCFFLGELMLQQKGKNNKSTPQFTPAASLKPMLAGDHAQ